MAEPAEPAQGSGSRKAPGLWLWGIAGIVYLLAVAAFWQYRQPGTNPWHVPYYALQLFALEFNEQPGVAVPPLLQVVRVLAPAVTVSGAALAVVGERAALWMRRTFRRGYTLVIGETAEARAVVTALRRASRTLVFPVADGHLESLRRAGIKHAGTVYVVAEDEADGLPNVGIALGASTSSLTSTRVFVHVKDSELALGLRARDLMTERTQALEYFMMDELAARAYVERDPLDPDARPEILVVGAGAFGRAVVVSFARHWRAVFGPNAGRVAVTLVDRNASAARGRLQDRWQVVEETCDITAIDTDDVTAALKVIRQPYRAYICYDDERVALRVALTARPLWHGAPGSLVVRLNELSEHAADFPSGPLFDDLGDRLTVANVAALAGPFVAAQPDLFEDLAQSIHTRYLGDQLRKGEQLGARPSLRPWSELGPVFRNSNIDQARHLAVKLRAIGATIAPRSATNPTFALTDAEVEMLAPMEHARWVRERTHAGWRLAAQTDPDRKRSTDLVPWDQLREESRAKDREAVRGLETTFADALADIGLQIVRL